ncbi:MULTISPECIES: hydrogenase 3 maturation endopeptidase HyCI [Aminobacterium]|uniref:hydrogenase 3 maturation endopeptidase HyCI n=1 Tax=Aminobacterium TaxID=81466 RepID=UPI0025807572|nr:hydrogenase 3 maturation endopeptidase HyCI [Aminobacterium sp. UBA4987]
MSTITLWGIGNPLFGDDGVGPFIAKELHKKRALHPITAIDCETIPENYIAPLKRNLPNLLLIVDAADMDLPPGSVRRIPLHMVENVSFSTHGLPLGMLLEDIAQKITIIYIGIQPFSQNLGESLSQKVKDAAEKLILILEKQHFEKIPLLYQENLSPK